MRPILIALSLALAAPAAAGPLQDAYNAAQAALDAGKYQEAADGFARLLATMPKADAPGNRTAAVIRSRLGAAYLALNQPELAVPVLAAALANLPAATDADHKERLEAQLDYAHALDLCFDRAKAKAAYREALDSALAAGAEGNIAGARIGLARLSVFDDPAIAREQLDKAIPLVEKLLATNRDQLADVYGLRGRIELNQGNLSAAKAWFEKGLKTAGGLGYRVSVYDTRVRSDLGIVSYLQKDRETARKYFAYTGAGHLPEGGLTRGADTPLPACGATTGIEPADIAIVEFSIGANGRVIAPTTIYSSRPGVIEDAFERAVASWSWRPGSLANLPPFWRSSVRLQLGCSNAGKRPSLSSPFYQSIRKWAIAQHVEDVPNVSSDAERVTLLRSELAKRLPLGDARQLVPIDIAIASNSLTTIGETSAALGRIAGAIAGEPSLSDAKIVVEFDQISMDTRAKTEDARNRRLALEAYPGLLSRIAARGAAKSRGAAYVGVNLAIYLQTIGLQREAEQQFQTVADLPETILPGADPIRQVALLRLASIAAARKDLATAQQRLDATGLSPEQCALADVRPARAGGSRITSNDFPPEALSWGFDGFASVSYDIDVSGRPTEARAVIAYPPFIFADGATKIIEKFRFMPIFRNGTSVGCNGMIQAVNFASNGNP